MQPIQHRDGLAKKSLAQRLVEFTKGLLLYLSFELIARAACVGLVIVGITIDRWRERRAEVKDPLVVIEFGAGGSGLRKNPVATPQPQRESLTKRLGKRFRRLFVNQEAESPRP